MQEVYCEVAVLGGGAAAMRAAIAAHDAGVKTVMVSKQTPGHSGNTVIARSGHAAPFSPADTPEVFVADILKAGEDVNHQPIVRALCTEACVRIEELVAWGVPFLSRDGRIETQPSAGHSHPRGCYTVKNLATEVAVVRCLELDNLCLTVEAIALAALTRQESRGTHYREDFPDRDEAAWRCNLLVAQTVDGALSVRQAPVVMD